MRSPAEDTVCVLVAAARPLASMLAAAPCFLQNGNVVESVFAAPAIWSQNGRHTVFNP